MNSFLDPSLAKLKMFLHIVIILNYQISLPCLSLWEGDDMESSSCDTLGNTLIYNMPIFHWLTVMFHVYLFLFALYG